MNEKSKISLDQEDIKKLEDIIGKFKGKDSFFGLFKTKGIVELLVEAQNGLSRETQNLESSLGDLKSKISTLQEHNSSFEQNLRVIVDKEIKRIDEKLDKSADAAIQKIYNKLSSEFSNGDSLLVSRLIETIRNNLR
jgi:FtsZ-binding cell division protein ZapB